jgi:hypothetical protein
MPATSLNKSYFPSFWKKGATMPRIDEYNEENLAPQVPFDTNLITGTEAIPLKDLLQYKIIQKRDECLLYKSEYYTNCILRSKRNKGLEIAFMGKLSELFDLIKASMKVAEEKKYKQVVKILNSRNIKMVVLAWDLIDDFLYKKKLTQYDNKKRIDETDPEARNREYGI